MLKDEGRGLIINRNKHSIGNIKLGNPNGAIGVGEKDFIYVDKEDEFGEAKWRLFNIPNKRTRIATVKSIGSFIVPEC